MRDSVLRFVGAPATAVLACLTAGAAPDAKPSNLLANGSFEDAGESTDLAAHWSRWGQWINRETGWTPTHSGTCEVGYHHWRIESADDSGLWQEAPVKKGQAYTFAVFVQHDRSNDHDAASIEVRLEATVDGRQVPIGSETTQMADLPTDGKWHRLHVTGTAPVDAVRALIRITPANSAPRGGAIKLDDATLTAAS